ncbi:MAG: DUF4350 domain-containing protein [Acidobacteria bacterium]|nr:DUF4350 domain-containing protein [Acidobacteriota bacterium]
MKQRLLIFFGLGLLLALLAGLNAASYVQKEKTPDREEKPNRSSYNSGPTGTQAFYTLLSETGRKVIRWQHAPADLLGNAGDRPSVFVVIGQVRRQFTPNECTDLLRWVAEGGRLVLIDRFPDEDLISTTSSWKINVQEDPLALPFNTDPSEVVQMVGKTGAAKPVQPSIFSVGVNAIQPSQFASSITLSQISDPDQGKTIPTPDPRHARRLPNAVVSEPSTKAPAVHYSSGGKNLVVDAPFGSGTIVFVSDPYLVSNGGISLVDNAQLGINLVSTNGTIAFDEFHQGFGDGNQFVQFFAGTPIIAIFFQAAALIAFVFYSQSRRFARPLPEQEPDRLSKLEYISAMSELQQRMRAFDLAMENLYHDFRRRACRLLGLDTMTTRYDELARAISDRTDLEFQPTFNTLFKCEDIIHGEPTNKAEMLRLTAELRKIETKLGLHRAAK